LDSVPAHFSDLELHWSMRFALLDHRSCAHSTVVSNVGDTQIEQVAGAKLRIYSQIEEGQVTQVAAEL
jgi:hypothetical protein